MTEPTDPAEPRPRRHDYGDEDAYIEAFAQWWERRKGLPVGGRDPDEARTEIRRTNAAVRAVSHVTQGSDAGVADAFDAFEAEADPLAFPDAAAAAAAAMVMPDDHAAVAAATARAVAAWRAGGESATAFHAGEHPSAAVQRIRGGIERAVWHVGDAVASVVCDVAAANLADRLDLWLSSHAAVRADDPDYEDRLRRAACRKALGERIGDGDMCAWAHDLARRENRRRPWLPTAHVFERAAPILARHPDPADRDRLIADLRAELALLDRVPYLPDGDEPGGTT